MTTEISDAARELYEWLDSYPHYPRWEKVKRVEHALTAAREQALEDVAKEVATWRNDVPMTGEECAAAIRAMKTPNTPYPQPQPKDTP